MDARAGEQPVVKALVAGHHGLHAEVRFDPPASGPAHRRSTLAVAGETQQHGRQGPGVGGGNELAAAECLLGSSNPDALVCYEPPMAGTKKRFDFLCMDGTGQRTWIEVKTVAPQWIDDEAGWQRVVRLAQDRWSFIEVASENGLGKVVTRSSEVQPAAAKVRHASQVAPTATATSF